MTYFPNRAKMLGRNIELLYRKGDILLCPLCQKEHYKVREDIYKKDTVRAGQVEALGDDVLNPAITVSQRCQFCMGGGAVPLVERVEGKSFK